MNEIIFTLIITLILGCFAGRELYKIELKRKAKRKKKNPDYCACKEICSNHLCKNMPDECCYDTRPWE
jgi:hypothetical protein